MGRIVLVTGGARSGKSRFAEARLRELQPEPPWLYFATAEPFDDELRARIARHQAARGDGFRTIEAPRDLAPAIAAAPDHAALVDCVTVWLSNRLLDGALDEALLDAAVDLATAAKLHPAPVVLVTNEVGAGIVPETPLGRRFRDLAGLVNQRLAAAADEVVLVTCGLPLRLR
ncbi:MAG TPA: bifunctional adenosylcobinamide kinase/adenosylcobinamide-phosphate guanylyltransferase [Polyangia bacterium]|nr:bifunctional adenosylcobinamide kinase/adenosylcobinamide-phosphate guanylyltransferase [Polyangia bacterium]